MFDRYTRILMAAAGVIGLLAGCATSTPGVGTDSGRVGSNPGGLSPQLVYEPPEFKRLLWSNVGSFEPVPENLEAAGRDFCSCQDTDNVKYTAIGYHPYAMGTDSYPIKGGGFLCVAN
jgi:hypothetical protein